MTEPMICTELGSVPTEECCIRDRFSDEALAECKRYMLLLMERFGEPPPGAVYWVSKLDLPTPDGGYILALCHLHDDKDAAAFAELVKGNLPRVWT